MAAHSIKRRLMMTVIVSQSLLAVGLLLAGLFYTHRRLVGSLDEAIQARAMSVAALVRYSEDASGNVYFDNTLMPPSIDPARPDMFAVWASRSGLVTYSPNWPDGNIETGPGGRPRWDLVVGNVPYRALRRTDVPILDREEGNQFAPQTLTIEYASPSVRIPQQMRQTAIFIALASLGLLFATVALAVWGIDRGLNPLRTLAGQAALVSANNWKLQLGSDVEDVSELRPVTTSMITMLARLERSFEQQGQFMGNAAHELKTPVAVLKSTLQSLLHRPRTAEEYRTGLEQSLEDLGRLEQLLQWMLRLARAEQWAHGALRRDLEEIDLTASCQSAVERIRGLANSRGTKVHLSSNGPMPLRADPEDLQLVWTNLLENAVRYSPEGASVEVSVNRNNGGPARVVFQDQGPGIAAADLPNIFERFYRGDPSRTRATGGFGLGLAIAKALVEAYGGTITAESKPGEGTRMTVELPIDLHPAG
jgi:signal transduction histidine kinase